MYSSDNLSNVVSSHLIQLFEKEVYRTNNNFKKETKIERKPHNKSYTKIWQNYKRNEKILIKGSFT